MVTLTKKRGSLIVLTGPSGVGKGTVLKEFFDKYGEDDFFFSISATTRSPREGEKEGVNYYYKTKEQFEEMIKNDEFLEYASFCENYYGTPVKPVEEKLEEGKNVILEIEVQGGLNVMKKRPDATSVFIAPPSFAELKSRITGRNTETEDVIAKRMAQAEWELTQMEKYRYIIVNQDVNKAASDFKAIVDAEGLKASNNKKFIQEVLKK